jgi:hypothetical protein
MNAAQQLIEQGRAEGREEGLRGLRSAIVAALAARSVALSELGRARLDECADVAVLTKWLQRAVTISSEADLFTSAT